MLKQLRSLLVFLGSMLLLIGIQVLGRFLVSVYRRRLQIKPPESLADPDSRFIKVNGINIHYKIFGKGEPVFLLIHGSMLSLHSWREVFEPLSKFGTVIAFDRPAFGLTDRPLLSYWSGSSPYGPEAQADLTLAFLDALGIKKAILVGNSAGGTLAFLAALRHPERVQALILVAAMIHSGYPVHDLRPWQQAALRKLGAVGPFLISLILPLTFEAALKSFWFDRTKLSPALLETYRKHQEGKYWAQAWWELILETHALALEEHFAQIKTPVLVITGDQDYVVATKESIQLAQELPNAKLEMLATCGHLPHEESPSAFVEAVQNFLPTIK